MPNILVVDDELSMRQFLTHLFQREGHTVRVAENGRRAMALLREQPADVVISDVKMPDMGGIELLQAARELNSSIEVIMMTAFANEATAHEAFLLGAFDFVHKPFDNDLLKEKVARALQKISIIKEKQALQDENDALIKGQRARGKLSNIIGQSDRMQAVYQMIETVAQVQSTILITGESGTGKELVARAIHDLSPRARKPFISINCGAFTEMLLESELFGYMKGSFTGAHENRKGLFQAAHGGTLFMDEIGNMSLTMQVKLYRVLQEGKVRPIGSTEEIDVDVRVIAATNKDFEKEIAEGHFREDLYYRLSVIPIHVPALRERREDIPLLARHFLERFRKIMEKPIEGISPEAMGKLEAYDWPGNVRELENTMERVVALETGKEISVRVLQDRILGYGGASAVVPGASQGLQI